MGSHIFGFFGVRQFFISTVSKRTRMFALQMKPVKCFSFHLKNGSIHKNKVTKLRSRKLHICPKVFAFIGVLVGFIIGHKID